MATYSFLDVQAELSGIGGSINLGAGSGAAEEGITIEPIGDKNIMTAGADGRVQHSLIANESANVTVKLLKESFVNYQLQTMYNSQTRSSSTHGRNTLTIRNSETGDYINMTQVAFANRVTVNYAKEAGMMEWKFHAGQVCQNEE